MLKNSQSRDQQMMNRLRRIQFKVDHVMEGQTKLMSILQQTLATSNITLHHKQKQSCQLYDVVLHLDSSSGHSYVGMRNQLIPYIPKEMGDMQYFDFVQNGLQAAQYEKVAVLPKMQQGNSQMQNSSKLFNILDKQMGLKFKQCENVYNFPELAKENIGEDKLKNPNFMLLMELTNKQIIGAFTEFGFRTKPAIFNNENQRCCLFNLTTEHFLYAAQTNKTHSYDNNCITFGNKEINVKMGEGILYSDLGKSEDCFTKSSLGGQDEISDRREWIFGVDHEKETFQLQKYKLFILR